MTDPTSQVQAAPTSQVQATAPQGATPATSGHGETTHQAVLHCPYCGEETLFPLEAGGWECRSCLRAFRVSFLGLASRARVVGAATGAVS